MGWFTVDWKPHFTNPFAGFDKVVKSGKKILSGDILGGAATALGLKDEEDKSQEAVEKAEKKQEEYQNKQLELAQKNIDSVSEMNKANLASQEKINQQNIDFSRELNNIQMQRADTAHSREFSDLLSAGISPYASMSGSPVGSLSAPVLNAPQNDIAGVSSSLGNMVSAIGNQASLAAENRQQSLNYALGLLSFVQGESKLKHQKDYDNNMVEIAKKRLLLDENASSYDNAFKEAQTRRANVESDVTLSNEERKKQLFASDIELRSLEIARGIATNENLNLSNARSQLAYSNEKKESEYTSLNSKLNFELKSQELANLIATHKSYALANSISELDLENRHLSYELTDAQIKKIMQDLELDPKRYKVDVVRNVIQGIFVGTNVLKSLPKPSNRIGF